MKYFYLAILLLAVTNTTNTQVPTIGLAAPDAYIFKSTLPLKRAATIAAIIRTEGIIDHIEAHFSRAHSEDYAEFCQELNTQIKLLAPKWLAEVGAGEIPYMDLSEMTVEEIKAYQQFYTLYYFQAYKKRGQNTLHHDASPSMINYLREEANKISAELDRDYIMVIDYTGTHWVNVEDTSLPVDQENMNGSSALTVSFFYKGSGLNFLSVSKYIGSRDNPKLLEQEVIIEELEKLVKKAYRKFVKKMW